MVPEETAIALMSVMTPISKTSVKFFVGQTGDFPGSTITSNSVTLK